MKIIDDRPTNKVTKHVIFGTAAEYGNVKKNYNPIKETNKCVPYSIYGKAKKYTN